MDSSIEVQEFLTSRRARLTPGQVGLNNTARRRVSGLRRSEVATLANLSTEYYTRLERGNLRGVSESILLGIAHALHLNASEIEHLFNLARAQNSHRRGQELVNKTEARSTPPSLSWMLEAAKDIPIIVGSPSTDLMTANALGQALYSEMISRADGHPNFARYIFLDETSHEFHPDWETVANDMVANLRIKSSRDPNDKALHSLIGELSTHSIPFRKKWANHEVRHFGSGTKRFFHPAVGELILSYRTFDFSHDDSLGLGLYAAEPGSISEERLKLLALWSAPNSSNSNNLSTSPRNSTK